MIARFPVLLLDVCLLIGVHPVHRLASFCVVPITRFCSAHDITLSPLNPLTFKVKMMKRKGEKRLM